MVKCPVCENSNNIQVLKLKDIPVNTNTLLLNRKTAKKAPLDEIDLRYCKKCTHLFNSAFKPKKVKYGSDYDNCLFFSPKYRKYVNKQIDHIIHSHSLKQQTIIEIGCGNGEYLELLCKKGDAFGIGFDPSTNKTISKDGRVKYYNKELKKDFIENKPKLIICRQTLEHIPNPKHLLKKIRELIKDNKGKVFIEVPNGLNLILENKVWDFIYEHVSYFTPDSLKRLINQCGFEVEKISKNFGEQYLILEAAPNNKTSNKTEKIDENIMLFSKKSTEIINFFIKKIKDLKTHKKKIVVWGMGSKGIMFLNLSDKNKYIEFGVDINPRKKGKYIPCTGHKIIGPEFLKEYKPDVIFVMNEIYIKEIQIKLKQMKLSPDLITV